MAIASLVVVVLLLAGGVVWLFALRGIGSSEALPDHLGMFVQSDDKTRLDEVRRQDFPNASDARNSLMRSEIASAGSQPNLVLYADSRDIPVNDLKLIQLDTMNDDGSMKTLDFQVAPVDGKPEMRRIRVPQALASGRYAFALFDGYFNEGRHKFWPFQVRDSGKGDNGDALRSTTVSLKPTPPPTPQPARASVMPASPPPPVGGTGYSATGNLVLRSGPGMEYPKIRNLAAGERLYILGYSSNVEMFKGRAAPYVQVRTMNGDIGWAFSVYLRQ